MEEASYYSIITAKVRYDTRLCAAEKLFYSEIAALTGAHGYCWAKNEYFARLYQVSERTIKRWLKNLTDNGYISVILEGCGASGRRIYLKETLPEIGKEQGAPEDEETAGEGEIESEPIGESEIEEKAAEERQPDVGQNCHPCQKCPEGVTKMSPRGDKIVTHNIIYNNKKNNKTCVDAEEGFSFFWKEYPRKKEKERARRMYSARRKEGIAAELMIEAAKAYALECKGKDERYIKHAATFLSRDKPFLDYGKKEEKPDEFSGRFLKEV